MITILFTCLVCFSVQCQNGFLGKKTLIELSGMGNIPMLSGSFKEDNYYKLGDEMIASRDFLDYGANLQISRILSKRIMLGLDLVYRENEVFVDKVFSRTFSNAIIGEYERTTNILMESAKIQHLSIFPVFTISPKKSYSGVGISHDLGAGYTIFSIKDRGYYYSLNEFEESNNTVTKADLYQLKTDWPLTHGISFRYGVHLQIPITSTIHLKFGAVNFLNLYFKPNFEELQVEKVGLFDYQDVFFNVQRENLFNSNLHAGIVFAL